VRHNKFGRPIVELGHSRHRLPGPPSMRFRFTPKATVGLALVSHMDDRDKRLE